MKAILYTKYGPPEMLEYKDIDIPTPKDHQIVVKVHAASINAMESRRFEKITAIGRIINENVFKSVGKPFGTDVAGVVERVGSAVTEFKVGDEVFGVAPGAYAEYVCNGASKFVHKPANVTFEQAAAVPVAGFTALQGLRDKGQIQAGQKVLIYGASGGVGTYAVQIAKAYGAEVTAVCRTRNVEMVRSLGADHVIDYTKEDFTKNGQKYDLIFAVNGSRTMMDYRGSLTPNGKCVVAGGSMAQILRSMTVAKLISQFGSRKIEMMGMAATPKDDLVVLCDLLATGKITPIIDRTYPLNETPQALRYVLNEHARGKVIITP